MTSFKKIAAVTGGALATLVLGGGLAFASATNAHAATVLAPAQSSMVATTAGTTAEDTEVADSTEAAGSAAETATASDGPGGHEDPAGDVQNEGGATEQ